MYLYSAKASFVMPPYYCFVCTVLLYALRLPPPPYYTAPGFSLAETIRRNRTLLYPSHHHTSVPYVLRTAFIHPCCCYCCCCLPSLYYALSFSLPSWNEIWDLKRKQIWDPGNGTKYGPGNGMKYVTGDGTKYVTGNGTEYGTGNGSNYGTGNETKYVTGNGTTYGTGNGTKYGSGIFFALGIYNGGVLYRFLHVSPI